MRALLLFSLTAVACSSPGSATTGKRGHATFAFMALPGCTDGCDLDSFALAADAEHTLLRVVMKSGYSYASTKSSDESVATFSNTSGGLSVESGQPGDADLILLDGAGAEVDRATLHVVAATKLDPGMTWSGSGPVILENVPIFGPGVTKRDAAGHLLLGAGLRFTVDGTLTSLGAPPPTPSAPPDAVESVIVTGQVGQGTLSATSSDANLAIPITVVSAADIHSTTVARHSPVLGPDGAVDVFVDVTVATASGAPVYGADCVWSVSDVSAVDRVDQGRSDQLGQPAVTWADFRILKTGTFTVTCTIDGRMETTPITRTD